MRYGIWITLCILWIGIFLFTNYLIKDLQDWRKKTIFAILSVVLLSSMVLGLYYTIDKVFMPPKVSKKDINTSLQEHQLTFHNLQEKFFSLTETTQNTEASNYSQKITEIEKTLSKNQEKINQLEKEKKNSQNQKKALEKEYQTVYQNSKFILANVPTYAQYLKYPNGCESVALYILLKYHGVSVSVEEIVNRLKKGPAPYLVENDFYGGNPEVEFVGDPKDPHGYGVFQKPIITVANTYKKGIKDISGTELDNILKIVKNGKPVQVWNSILSKDTSVCKSWYDEQTNKKINWICNLHSLVIVGYTHDQVICSDPYTGKIEYYNKVQFRKMYNLFGRRAIYYE